MKVLKALALASVSFAFSLPLFADIYQCQIGVGWFADAEGKKWETKVLGSGNVDTAGNPAFFPIENTKFHVGCGGIQAGFSNLNFEADPVVNTNTGFLCMLAPVQNNAFYFGISYTKIGAPLTFGVRIGDETLPMKNKVVFAMCAPQGSKP
jgi:hypothetical protein